MAHSRQYGSFAIAYNLFWGLVCIYVRKTTGQQTVIPVDPNWPHTFVFCIIYFCFHVTRRVFGTESIMAHRAENIYYPGPLQKNLPNNNLSSF